MPRQKNCKVASICPHFGEEPFISGTKGSGAIFFSNCTMRCLYCQNWQISWGNKGEEITPFDLAGRMLKLESDGLHNINLVSPTQQANAIIEALKIAKGLGLKIPIVYNTNGFDSITVLKKFNGLVDIYLPDIKYSVDDIGYELSGVKGYVERNREAIFEMFGQVGNLVFDKNDMATRGLIIRHLVLPFGLAGSYESLKFVSSLSKDIWLSIMSQYKPHYKAKEIKKLSRKITPQEYAKVLSWVEDFGFTNVLAQELDSPESYNPDFDMENPFL